MGSILLVEVDPTCSERWSSALTAAGHAVLVASTTKAAPFFLRDGGIDVVVLDAHDPRNAAITDLARSIEALPDAPPMILVSGSPAAPELSARIGAAAFLPKPCEPHELVAAVTRLASTVRPVRDIDDDEPTGRHKLLD